MGHIHPLSQMITNISRIFSKIGFEISDGPEMESEENNFDLLNIPKDHPARDMHDTFWVKDRPGFLMRTHISAHQVPYMRAHKPPLRMISAGRVFRYEATDATHEVQFNYVEGLAVDKGLSLADLKGTLEFFLKEIFMMNDLKTRFRPSFFPFVEPGVEIDMSCFKCSGSGCNICKQTGWIEIMGAGMVHPKVLESAGVNSREFSGFAFGVGIDRLAMLKYGVDDVRLFYSGDLRLVNQF